MKHINNIGNSCYLSTAPAGLAGLKPRETDSNASYDARRALRCFTMRKLMGRCHTTTRGTTSEDFKHAQWTKIWKKVQILGEPHYKPQFKY